MRNLILILGLAVIVSFSILALDNGFVSALECEPNDVIQDFKESDIVFHGLVISKDYEFSNSDLKMAVTEFSILKSFKGITNGKIIIYSNEMLWGYNLTKGDEYIVFAERQYDRVGSQLCTATGPANISYLNLLEDLSSNVLPPLKQMNSGVPFKEISCKTNLELISKYDGTLVCVKPSTFQKLIHRNWIQVNFEQNSLNKFVNNTSIKVKPTILITPEIINGDWYILVTGTGWNPSHNVEIEVNLEENKISSIRSNTNELGIFKVPWLVPSFFSSGVFEFSANDGINNSHTSFSVSELGHTVESDSYYLKVDVTGEKQVRRGVTHSINVQVTNDNLQVDGAIVIITIENYGGDVIRDFRGKTDHEGKFIFSWEVPKTFDDLETLFAYVDVTDGLSSQTKIFKFQIYCFPGEKNCKIKGN